MYKRKNDNPEFRYMHVFTKIEDHEKWKKTRLNLRETGQPYDLDATADASAVAEKLDENIVNMLAACSSNAKERADASAARFDDGQEGRQAEAGRGESGSRQGRRERRHDSHHK